MNIGAISLAGLDQSYVFLWIFSNFLQHPLQCKNKLLKNFGVMIHTFHFIRNGRGSFFMNLYP
jgi:hypothetical protein